MMMMMMMMMGLRVNVACQCDVTGSTGLECDAYSGQCPCRANILGRCCDSCDENKYNVAAGCLGLYSVHRAKLTNLATWLPKICTN